MKVTISGLINTETTLKINEFPIHYYPVDYPFFGIQSHVSGVAYNLAKSLHILNNEVDIFSMISNDYDGNHILTQLKEDGINNHYIQCCLKETPSSVILYDNFGKRQVYSDLKDIQEKTFDPACMDGSIKDSDLVIACNINFNRPLLKYAKSLGKTIATDVHVLNNIHDEYNCEFMEYSDILFLSDERLPYRANQFLLDLKNTYDCRIIVLGQGDKGCMLYERSSDKLYHLDAVTGLPVINTVGAGDALFSSFLNYYMKGFDAITSLKFAELFAAKKIGVNGAANGFITESELETLYSEKEIAVYELL